MKKKHNGGYSLIEILIAIAVLGIVTIPATSSLLTAHRVNVQAEKMLTAQLQVSSAVETLMAEGIVNGKDYKDNAAKAAYPNVEIDAIKATESGGTELPYYNVTVTSTEEDSVFVTTHIRAVPEITVTPEEGGGTE